MAEKNERKITRERDPEQMSIVEQQRARAEVQAKLGAVKGALKIAAAGIDVPLNTPMEPNASDILALERAVAELKKAAGIAA
jgi:polyhydroxyalkanoate synthesis regulator phasin